MFICKDHEERYSFFIQQDRTNHQDVERQAMFYIFAGNNELAGKIHYFYDFVERMIRIDGSEEVSLSSSAKLLVELGFNLYNNYPCGTIVELFGNLDNNNQALALNAVKIRFRME